jgi:3-oxoacyl-[acyl-carrier protein] reductase
MEKNKYGKIIAITMQAAEVLPIARWLPYITGKAALGGFSKALAMELAPKGIRVNMISPSLVDTNLISDIPETDRLIIASKTPLRRIAKPEDIANTIFFLASAESDFITGETIRVSGGQIML